MVTTAIAALRELSSELWAQWADSDPSSAGLDSDQLREAFGAVVFTASLPDYGLRSLP